MKTLGQLASIRVVTAPQGSWKWQKPYRVVEYRARKCANGKICWFSFSQSGKYSEPQLTEYGYANLPRGSLHNQQISRQFAVSQMGVARVAGLEGSGWEFGQ